MKETPSPAGKSESGGKQMDLRRLTIGEMAALNHISEQTLRLYDREELLVPLHRDEKARHIAAGHAREKLEGAQA